MASLDELIQQTEALVARVPQLARAFPDFRTQLRLLNATGIQHSAYMLGTIKSGKSTLINALLGRDVMPRGAGVKTFNQVKVRAGTADRAVVHFRSGAELKDLLTFDYRLLGFEFELPEDPYSAAAEAELATLQERFEAECASDQRLSQVKADAALEGLLPRALARVERTLAGLATLRTEFDDATRETLQRDGAITYEKASFEQHRRWTDSADLAALIRSIEMTMPFPARLAESLQLVDCQGSDSLNPLDFADIESVVQHADLLLYVVQSRLGIRQADRRLLAHLASAGERILPVLNVEAFSPLSGTEFAALEQHVARDIEQCLGRRIEPLPVVALRPLLQSTGDKDQLRAMKRLWDKQGDRSLWSRLEGGYDTLLERLNGLSHAQSARTDAQLQRFLVQQATSIARDLLARDERIVGHSSEKTREEVEVAVASLIEGERTKLKAAARRATDTAFDSAGPIQREVDELNTGPKGYVEDRPIPADVRVDDGPGPILDAALGVFNADWLQDRAPVRQAEMIRLEDEFSRRLIAGAQTVLRLLPEELADDLPDAIFAPISSAREAVLRRLYEEAASQRTAPRTLAPVVLGSASRHTLTTKYYAGEVQQRIQARLRGAVHAERLEPSVVRSTGLRKFWRQCMKAAFHHASADRSHALGNARENYKYQYFFPIIDLMLNDLQARIVAATGAKYDRLQELERGRRLLLDADARAQVAAYLHDLETRFERESARTQEAVASAID